MRFRVWRTIHDWGWVCSYRGLPALGFAPSKTQAIRRALIVLTGMREAL